MQSEIEIEEAIAAFNHEHETRLALEKIVDRQSALIEEVRASVEEADAVGANRLGIASVIDALARYDAETNPEVK